MNSWVILIIAGLCEIVWALGLKSSEGLTKPYQSVVTIIFMAISVYLLAVASRQIPMGISYTIWVGIGTIGTFIGNILIFNEKTTTFQIFFFTIVVIGIAGLKFTTND
jgi:quaternary ammonium compound-resistance protein SugE